MDLAFERISVYHDRLRLGQTTVKDEVLRCLESARSQAHLNAFLELYAEEALERAEALDQEISVGNLKPL
ncbi:MAG: hypothetical protein ACKO7X_04315, partial [Bacteroidota bacterium]